MTIKLIYTGRGEHIFHVPSRDLTDEDFAERAELWQEHGITDTVLIESGLYKKVEAAQAEPKKSKRGTAAAEEGE
jgi:hypothetical protein